MDTQSSQRSAFNHHDFGLYYLRREGENHAHGAPTHSKDPYWSLGVLLLTVVRLEFPYHSLESSFSIVLENLRVPYLGLLFSLHVLWYPLRILD
jgi:hypothetical protein